MRRSWESRRTKREWRKTWPWLLAWGIGLLLYGAADTSDTDTAASLTAEVDRAEVVSWLLEDVKR